MSGKKTRHVINKRGHFLPSALAGGLKNFKINKALAGY
jgi:hypothetical protein